MPLQQALELEARGFGRLSASADKKEGVAAFLEKRSANFSGH
jgi:enoyl-CoA hydratase/carnithine racemase